MDNTGTKDLKSSIPISGDRTAYAFSFGNMPNQTEYYNPYHETDMIPDLKAVIQEGFNRTELKALTTTAGGAGTAGYAMIPIYVDPRIVDTTRKFTPWVSLLPRVTNQGITADYNKITVMASAISAEQDAPLSDVTDTEDRASTNIKYLYSVGRVTGQMQAAMPSYVVQGLQPQGTGITNTTFGSPSAPNAKQYEVLKRASALRKKEESLIWTGNASTDSTEFDGIVQLQSTTNQLDKSSTALSWSDFETIAQYAYDDSGRPTLGACDSSTLADTRKIMIDSFRFSAKDLSGTVGFGVPAAVTLDTLVGPIPIVPSQYLTNTTGAKQMFFLDMEFIEMRVLQDMTYEDLAKTNDSQKFMLKIYEALIMKNTAFNAFIDNIS